MIFKKSLPAGRQGFTLIELLVVIAVMAVISAAVLVAIDPIDKINAANDSKVQADVGQLASASVAYATSHNGSFSPDLDSIKTEGELQSIPKQPGGADYVYTPTCAGGICTSVVISGSLKSKKYTAFATWMFDSSTGVACAWDGSACKP